MQQRRKHKSMTIPAGTSSTEGKYVPSVKDVPVKDVPWSHMRCTVKQIYKSFADNLNFHIFFFWMAHLIVQAS